MKGQFTTAELDSIARLGLDDMRACFGKEVPPGAAERAALGLKFISEATKRMGSENGRANALLKIAKAIGVSREDQQIIWQEITNGGAIAKTAESLASVESETSEQTAIDSQQSAAPARGRSQKAP